MHNEEPSQLEENTMVQKFPTTLKSADPNNSVEPLAVTILEGCRIIGIRRSSIYREISAGRIRAVKAGKRTLLPMASLRAWLAALPQSKAA